MPLRRLPRQRGFTYLWLLLLVAIGAAALAALGQRASTALQREREAELIFRGREIARALASFRAATPGDAKVLPTTLAELLDDRRGPRPRRHLRRLYADPFTGRADWVLLKDSDERITGVRSRSAQAALRTVDLPAPAEHRSALVSDRLFIAAKPAAVSAAAPTTPPE
jgi:type II secretory pathway pseudopilin PulG